MEDELLLHSDVDYVAGENISNCSILADREGRRFDKRVEEVHILQCEVPIAQSVNDVECLQHL